MRIRDVFRYSARFSSGPGTKNSIDRYRTMPRSKPTLANSFLYYISPKMAGNGTSRDLLAILEKSFSQEGRRGANTGQGTGTGVDADGADGRGSGSEPGPGAGQVRDHEVKTGELPAEIKNAIDKLELLKGGLEDELGIQ